MAVVSGVTDKSLSISVRLFRALCGVPLDAARVFFLLIAALLTFVIPAAAQSGRPAVLTEVRVGDDRPGEAHVSLVFNQSIPQYTIVANDGPVTSIAFGATVRGQSASTPDVPHAVLGSIAFEQNDTILSLTLNGIGPIHISAVATDSHTLGLTIRRAGPPERRVQVAAQQYAPVISGPTPSPRGNFVVVPLKYADVSEVVGLLTGAQGVKSNDNFSPQEPAFGSAGMGGAAGPAPSMFPAPGTTPADDAVGQTIDENVGIDRRLNAIILRGSPAHIAVMKAMIAQLDVPVTSVVLETVFVELTENGARNVGLDFNNGNSQVAVLTYDTGAFNPFSGGSARGQLSASLQAAVYAQVKEGQGKIISKPRIAAQSGASAKIVTGDALPILTSIALSGVNAVSQQVQYVNVGVTLQIAPRVSDNGDVTSHIFCEVSSVTGYSQGYPTISQREATTSATVKDGESFVIGGLSQENKLSSDDRVPVLGDLPLIGSLFNYDSGTSSKTDLYIIVTPHIVHGRDPAAMDVLKSAQ